MPARRFNNGFNVENIQHNLRFQQEFEVRKDEIKKNYSRLPKDVYDLGVTNKVGKFLIKAKEK